MDTVLRGASVNIFAVLGLVVVLIVQTGVISYWGGRVWQSLQTITADLPPLRMARQEHSNLLGVLVERLQAIDEKLLRERGLIGEIRGEMDSLRESKSEVTNLRDRVRMLESTVRDLGDRRRGGS